MGIIISFLLILFGREPFSRSYVSSVSRSIDYLPCKKSRKWFWGGLVHYAPVVVVIGLITHYRWDLISHGWREWVAFITAVSWGFIGPTCIWIFERNTLPRLWGDCRKKLLLAPEQRFIRGLIFSNTLSLTRYKLITAAWMILVVYYFIKSQDFMVGFGVVDYHDPLWWAILIGVILFSYYSALGICFVFRAVSIVNALSRCSIDAAPYDPDNSYGFSFVGTFALRTNFMFLTGWLFVPLLGLASLEKSNGGSAGMLPLILGYSLIVAVAFFLPVWVIHRKLKLFKAVILKTAISRVAVSFAEHERTSKQSAAINFFAHRAMLDDMRRVTTWPLNLGGRLRFVISNAIFPLVVGYAIAWLDKTK